MLAVLLTAFIFGNSSADGDTSSGLSLLVTQWLNGVLEWMSIPFRLSHHLVRKLAHFAEYSLLGGLLTASARSWRREPWSLRLVWIPAAIGGCIASLDEWLQTFIPDRYGCIPDVLLDLCGVAWAALAVSLLFALRKNAAENKT